MHLIVFRVMFAVAIALTMGGNLLADMPETESRRTVMANDISVPPGLHIRKPADKPLSAATERLYGKWGIFKDSTNEFYTNFYYSEVTGIGKEEGVTRRDPTTVIKLGDTYYVWYTHRKIERERDHRNRPAYGRPQKKDVPAYDWDLSEIWCATSKDGFNWTERGVAARRGPEGSFDARSIFTPDVLVAGGKYYLYYQAVGYPYVRHTRNVVGMSWADSPDGPWHRWPEPVLEPGEPGEWMDDGETNNVKRYGAWDSHKVHDPFLIVRDGKFWLYYKGQPMGWGARYGRGIGLGVAISDKPEGPFVKSPLNPVTNSGHETLLFPYKEGVVAICSHDGPEKDTVQYAPDGLNFEVMANVTLPPCAGGPFAPDSYSDTKDGRGITWGLAHIATEETKGRNSYIVRFDCNLHRDVERPGFRRGNIRMPENVHFSPDMQLRPHTMRQRKDSTETATGYPVKPSERRPEVMSAATRRTFDIYGIYKDRESDFFSAFMYSAVRGIGKEPGVTRRDPSKVIKIGETYYVWYTHRRTALPPQGIDKATDTIPATDWDLAEIWCATSKDGFNWQEQGRAVGRGPEGQFDDRSVFTPDVLAYKGKYYLYYQVTDAPYRNRGLHQVGMSWAESPEGPWHRWPEVVVPVGAPPELVGDDDDPNKIAKYGDWDSHRIHDPYVLVRDGKIWLFYKGVRHGKKHVNDLGIAWGVAIADEPEGPFHKHPLNPVTNSGHETFLYPFKEGIAAVVTLDGPEKNTVQYAADGVNFEVMGKVSCPPTAAGPYVPDAFDDTTDGKGVTWGLSHIMHDENGRMPNSYIVRFDCDLSREIKRDGFYRPWNFRFPESAYLKFPAGMSESMKQAAKKLMKKIDVDTIGVRL